MAADVASAVANAVGAIAGTVSSFVNKAAQEFGLKKGMEVGTVKFEQNKTLAAYNSVSESRKYVLLLIVALAGITMVLILFKKK